MPSRARNQLKFSAASVAPLAGRWARLGAREVNDWAVTMKRVSPVAHGSRPLTFSATRVGAVGKAALARPWMKAVRSGVSASSGASPTKVPMTKPLEEDVAKRVLLFR